jgi:methylglutamate dehydrogenase subunit D
VSNATTTRSGHTVHPTHQALVQVHMTAQRLQSVTLLSTWASGIEALTQAMHSALGCTPPAHTGHATACEAGLLMRSGPLEFMLIGAHPAPDRVAQLRAHIPAEIGSVLDLSHARIRVQLHGAKAVDALAKLYALDFRPAAFPVGRFQLTGHHHIPCVLHRLDGQHFELYFLSTYAHGQIEALMDVALEYGVELNGI